ncbi:MAG: AbrB/MazE/SpoVT family DNA-binding domain-containing protein [Propionibacteriaceae bacterium]|jgi:AbrB family looped-hinge helix DNA binding protein|nr:AbrB/MazE/SpoVT family DNA-binding domain-containing protein [Propionibacteriaceae bacterium]
MPSAKQDPSFPWQHFPSPGKMYGAATVGERGQLAIPADARRELSINPGDKMVVFGNRLNGAVILIKADIFEDFADFFMTKLNKLEQHAQEFFGAFTVAEEPAAEEPVAEEPVAEEPVGADSEAIS